MAMVCGAFVALSAIETDPKRLPDEVGVKVTLITQLVLGARLAGQLLIWEKFPLTVTPVMTSAALPVLVSVTGCEALGLPIDWLGKVSVVGDSVTTGTAFPAPDRSTVCVLLGMLPVLSVTVRMPERGPDADGVKVTLITQLPAGARTAPQVLVVEKSPVTVILPTLRGAAPELLSVTVWALLVVPIGSTVNPRLATESDACGVGFPLPDREIVCGLLVALSAKTTVPKRLPATVGVNVTLMVQLALGATLEPQLLTSAKSP